jgi:hypothetical protein
MFLHGPVFFYWTCAPVFLYIVERYMQNFRGNREYSVIKIDWIPPVMGVYFRPKDKADMRFKEGQYVYLACPHISKTEWHPFTISSAHDDLHFGPRISLKTGEEVYEVPRGGTDNGSEKSSPARRTSQALAASSGKKRYIPKYCLVSQNYADLHPDDYMDKSETGYNDFISCHIKVIFVVGCMV